MTESEIIDRLCRVYSSHICIPHLKLGTGINQSRGYSVPDKPFHDPDCERSIDLFTFATLRSLGFVRTAFEVKVSVADFYRELSSPVKRRGALRFANKYYFVAPPDTIPRKKIPAECGLIEVTDDLHIVVEAPWHDNAPTWGFLASVLRRMPTQLNAKGR